MPNILITGAAKGLGLELARFFHTNAYGLYLIVRSEASGSQLKHEFPQAEILLSDVTQESHAQRIEQSLDGVALDVLINNAGIEDYGTHFDTATAENIRRVFDTNCVGAFETTKGALNALKRAETAYIINISSRFGSLSMQASRTLKGNECSYAYRISKAAQNMLTICLADDLEAYGIRVAAIHPGRLLTKMASKDAHMLPQESAERIGKMILNREIISRDYLCVETGKLDW